jgi:hypothetical protein
LLAATFPFLGLFVIQLGYPHTEPLFIGLFGAGLAALMLGVRRWVGYLLVGLSMTVRQDCGLHVFSFFGVLALYSFRHGEPRVESWRWVRLGLAGLFVSATLMLVQRIWFHSDDALVRIIGEPPFAHLTVGLMRERLASVLHEKSYIWLPMALSAVLAAIQRDPIFLVGWIGTLPWLALCLAAKPPATGLLFGYYAFPLGLGIFSLVLGLKRHYAPGLATATIVGLLVPDVIANSAFYDDLVRLHSFGTEFSYEAGRCAIAPLAAAGAGCDQNIAGMYPGPVHESAIHGHHGQPDRDVEERLGTVHASERSKHAWLRVPQSVAVHAACPWRSHPGPGTIHAEVGTPHQLDRTEIPNPWIDPVRRVRDRRR